jgi:tetratricopeptide (TPR) repeat protein
VIPPVPLNDAKELAKKADAAFAREAWLEAAANYNGLITIAEKVGVAPEQIAVLYHFVGISMLNLGEYEEALRRFSEYRRKFPAGPNIQEAILGMARSLHGLRRFPEAIKEYKFLLGVPALREEALIELADCYRQNQETDQGISLLETTLASGVKTDGDPRAALALVELYEDRPEKALVWLEKVNVHPHADVVIG